MLDDNDENGPAWGDRDYTYEEVCICVQTSFVAFCFIAEQNTTTELSEDDQLYLCTILCSSNVQTFI